MRVLIYFTLLFSTIIAKSQNEELNFSFGHTKNISAVNFSFDGKYAISAATDKKIKLWDIQSGKEIKTFYGFNSVANVLEFFPKSNKFIVGFNTGEIQIVDIETKHTLNKLDVSDDEIQQIVNIEISANESQVLIAFQNEIKIWNLEINSIQFSKKVDEIILNARFFPQSTSKIIVSSKFQTNIPSVKIIDTKSNLVDEINTENQIITKIEFLDSTKVLLASNKGKTLKYNLKTKQIEFTYEDMFNTEISSFALSSDNKYFLSGTIDGEISIWNVDSMENIRRTENVGDKIIASKFVENSTDILFCSNKGLISVWNLIEMKPPKFLKFSGSLQNIKTTACSSNLSLIASAFDDNKIRIFKDSSNIEIIANLKGNIKQLLFSNDNLYLFILTSESIYNENTGTLNSKTRVYKYSIINKNIVEISTIKPNVLQIEMLENNSLLLIYKNGKIESIDQTILIDLNTEFENSTTFYFSNSRKLLSISTDDSEIQIIDLQNNKTILISNFDFVNAVVFSENDDSVYVFTNSGKINIYEILSQKLLQSIKTGIENYTNIIKLNTNEFLFVNKKSNKSILYTIASNEKNENNLYENVCMLSKNTKFTIATTFDGKINIINNENQNVEATIYALMKNYWLIVFDDNTYNCNEIFDKSVFYMNMNVKKEQINSQKKSKILWF